MRLTSAFATCLSVAGSIAVWGQQPKQMLLKDSTFAFQDISGIPMDTNRVLTTKLSLSETARSSRSVPR